MKQEPGNSRVGEQGAGGRVDEGCVREMELLISLARLSLSVEEIARVGDLVRAGINWESFTSLALRHRLFPLVTKHLSLLEEMGVPEALCRRYKQMMRQHVVKSMVFTSCLNRIVAWFEEKNIRVIPFKGPQAAQHLFGDYALRMYGDLDLLVDRNQVEQVFTELVQRGFTPEFDVDPSLLQTYSALDDSISFTAKDQPTVELHWELSGRSLPRPFDLDSVSERLASIELESRQVPVFSNEDLLIYYCLHGCKHNWEQYELVVCVGRHIEAHPIEWSCVRERAAGMRCARILRVGVLLAKNLYRVSVPDEIAQDIKQDRKAQSLAMGIEAVLRKGRSGLELAGNPHFRFLRFQLKDSLGGAFSYMLRLFFAPSKAEWKLVRLPSRRFVFLYWLLRPCRLLIAAMVEFFNRFGFWRKQQQVVHGRS